MIKIPKQVVRALNLWYFRNKWDKFLYFLYTNFKFFSANPKLKDRFFFKDFKKDIATAPVEQENRYCTLIIRNNSLVHISEFCTDEDQAHRIYDTSLVKYAGSNMSAVTLNVSDEKKVLFDITRNALLRHGTIPLPEELVEATITKSKKRGKTKNVKARRRGRRPK